MKHRLRVLAALLAVFLGLGAAAVPAQEGEAFVVRDMRVEGLQRIAEGTVYNYLPVSIGDTLDEGRVAEAIRAVYGTGLFADVEFRRDGSTLVIAVRERPSIRRLTITGNKDIKTEDLEESLRGVGLSRGQTFDRPVLEEVERFMTDQYYSRGKYGVIIDTRVDENEAENTVDITITIQEGERARIRQVAIVGNEVFSDEEILDEFQLRTPNWLSWYRQDDRYARESLVGDLETLQSFYMDRGYANFDIESTQVQISPDRQDIFIAINVSEGEPHRIADIRLAGQMPVPEEQLRALVLSKPGDTFSRRQLTQTAELITFRLGEEGFAFARVDPVPTITPGTNEVSVTFYIEPGKRAYVRRINFAGTTSTNDEVLRREMRQLEGAYLSNRALDRSEERVRRLPFIEDVQRETFPVIGTDDLVDVEFAVKEGLPGSFGGGVGYSGLQGVIFNANFVHTNFLGTGNRIEADVNTGRFSTVYSFLHTNPYVTPNGVSRTVSASYRDITQFVSGASEFGTKTASLGIEYGYPISEYTRLRAGVQLYDSRLLTNASSPFQSIRWVRLNGDSRVREVTGGELFETQFQSYELLLGWTYDSRNRVFFADRGSRHRIQLNYTVPGSSVEYYSASLDLLQYLPFIGPTFIEWSGEIAYTDALGDTTEVPPFKRYFGGGPGSVRGYREGWLGPLDTNENPYGGNFELSSQLELIIPLRGEIARTTRFSLFFDAGNIFSTDTTPFFDRDTGEPLNNDFSFSELRYSTGISFQWLAPLGLFRFSYAFPLNDEPGDRTEGFQFTVGSAF
ncbi:outer membrane protein assembly factor BamA [Thioalkalivibrio sp. XN8]|uniref:outer membrane protein assembly factor BamA n=1 Tax=Thioalkalivibrio sp. XN8 TaxID=2712863 RepID=UPI0013E9D7A4|nr:outer membrane protein assembly factor BamA [Thioalkalivibrio sp. XN8]